MKPVFLDTVGLLASWDGSDQWHHLARPVLDRLIRDRRPLVTTTFVMLECGNAAARRPYRSSVDVLRRLLHADGRLLVPTEDDQEQAWRAYESDKHTSASIVDHVSFTIMRRLGIDEVFTNDRHFAAAGFVCLF